MKKKRYRSNVCKGVWLGLVHVSLVAALVCGLLFVELLREGINPFLDRGTTYTDSAAYATNVLESAYDILDGIRQSEQASADGIMSGVMDLKEVLREEELTYRNTSGMAYSVKDLIEWAKSGWEYGGEMVLICTKPDGGYEYWYYQDFAEQLKQGSLNLEMDQQYWMDNWASDGESEEEALEQIQEWLRIGNYWADYGIETDGAFVTDGQGTVVYRDVRNYSGEIIKEKYTPMGADSMLDVLNNNPWWNGRLDEAVSALEDALNYAAGFTSTQKGLEQYAEGNTNLSYLYVDLDTQKVYTNKSDYAEYDAYKASVEKMRETGSYIYVSPILSEWETNLFLKKEENLRMWQHMLDGLANSENYLYIVNVDTEFPIADNFSENAAYYNRYQKYVRPLAGGTVLAAVIFLIGLIWLTVAAGRSPEDEDIHLCAFDRWYTELSALVVLIPWLAMMFLGLQFGAGASAAGRLLVTVSLMGFFTAALFFTGYLSLVRRIKANTLWKDSLLRRICIVGKKIWRKCGELVSLLAENTSSKIKMLLLLGVFLLCQFGFSSAIVTGGGNAGALVILIVLDGAAMLYGLYKADGRDKILEGLRRITSGELQYQIPTEKLYGEQKTMAKYVNRIGEGLDAAVEKSVKNERMKTELITNVSHDIKTPLTSIINYVDLLKRENFTDPKICGYLDILEAKAQRLKTLTEDVVEASKASTGNITLELTDLDFVQMIRQVIGEFEERFQEKGLVMMVRFSEEPSVIRADGQRMWRILENIFNNVVKYAMEGTRVYAEVSNMDQKVIFSLKNISAEPLNISAEELTERFIRGDSSRNTEGSGLGLSIAQSLTTLQGGEFKLCLDGDLFKVVITFTQVK